MNCAACHGYDLKGGMGPDLTDTYWRYGGSPADIYKSIFEGRPQGMPAWGRALPPAMIWKVVGVHRVEGRRVSRAASPIAGGRATWATRTPRRAARSRGGTMCTERRRAAEHAMHRPRSARRSLLAACNGTTSYLDATGAAGRRGSDARLVAHRAWRAWSSRSCASRSSPASRAIAATRTSDDRRDGSGSDARSLGADVDLRRARASTVVILLVTFAGTMVTLNAASHPPRTPSLTMDVTGHQWWWEVTLQRGRHIPTLGFTTANEVHLPVGEPVRVRLHSADVIHSFWLPQIAGKTDVIPGQVNEMWLEAEQARRSRAACAASTAGCSTRRWRSP